MSNSNFIDETIIMVDDDITNLSVARNILADKYNFFTAPSGFKLFQILQKVKPALILLDVEMPELDGYEIVRMLKRSESAADIPVIFLTAKIDPICEIKGLELGVADYVTKPFSGELLIKRINVHLLLERQRKEIQSFNRMNENRSDLKSKTDSELQTVILKAAAELVERRNKTASGKIERTQHYLRLLVDFLIEHGVYVNGLSSWEANLLSVSSKLHDSGKLVIGD